MNSLRPGRRIFGALRRGITFGLAFWIVFLALRLRRGEISDFGSMLALLPLAAVVWLALDLAVGWLIERGQGAHRRGFF